MTQQRSLAIVAACLALFALPAAGQGEKGKAKHGKPAISKADKPRAAERDVRIQPPQRVSDDELRIIRDYYRTNRSGLKPLPPGIAKNLERGKPIPPGIARTRLPERLYTRLTPRPGYEWILAGDRLLLVDRRGLLVDLVERIF